MLNLKNIGRALKNPGLLPVAFKRFFPWQAVRQDRECFHLISAWSSGRLPRVSLQQAFPGIESCDVILRKAEARIIGWSLDLPELVHVVSVLKFTKARRILEIGTYDGFTALNLAANLDAGGEVRTVDLPQNQDQSQLRSEGGIPNACTTGMVGSQFQNEPEAQRIRQLWGDSTTTPWENFGGPFDVIFIDGCHEYSFVLSDSRNAFKHIRPGGTIFWHDYGQFPDVSKAVDELAREHPIQIIAGTRLACLRIPAAKAKQ